MNSIGAGSKQNTTAPGSNEVRIEARHWQIKSWQGF